MGFHQRVNQNKCHFVESADEQIEKKMDIERYCVYPFKPASLNAYSNSNVLNLIIKLLCVVLGNDKKILFLYIFTVRIVNRILLKCTAASHELMWCASEKQKQKPKLILWSADFFDYYFGSETNLKLIFPTVRVPPNSRLGLLAVWRN